MQPAHGSISCLTAIQGREWRTFPQVKHLTGMIMVTFGLTLVLASFSLK
jgi:hypothetical protein